MSLSLTVFTSFGLIISTINHLNDPLTEIYKKILAIDEHNTTIKNCILCNNHFFPTLEYFCFGHGGFIEE